MDFSKTKDTLYTEFEIYSVFSFFTVAAVITYRLVHLHSLVKQLYRKEIYIKESSFNFESGA